MDAIKEGMLASAKAAEAAARIGERLFGQNTPSVMNFSSQICTTREQSERLLALGLKKETADMCWIPLNDGRCVLGLSTEIRLDIIPAWSLGRLLELALCDVEMNIFISRRCFWINKPHLSPTRSDLEGGVFDGMIDYIEWLIKQGYFPKEYLV